MAAMGASAASVMEISLTHDLRHTEIMFDCRFIEHFSHCLCAGFVSANVTPWAGNSLIEGGAGYIRCCLMGCLSWVCNSLCCRHFHSWVAGTQSLASVRGSMKPLQVRIR